MVVVAAQPVGFVEPRVMGFGPIFAVIVLEPIGAGAAQPRAHL
jgi:hypothetical protein